MTNPGDLSAQVFFTTLELYALRELVRVAAEGRITGPTMTALQRKLDRMIAEESQPSQNYFNYTIWNLDQLLTIQSVVRTAPQWFGAAQTTGADVPVDEPLSSDYPVSMRAALHDIDNKVKAGIAVCEATKRRREETEERQARAKANNPGCLYGAGWGLQIFFGSLALYNMLEVHDPDLRLEAVGVPLLLAVLGVYFVLKERRKPIAPMGYPLDWGELRRQALERDGYRCGNCGMNTATLHVHHIVPLSRGGTNSLGNLWTLCEDCHKLIHPHMR